MVRSPDDESVDEGECESDSVGGLSFDETEVTTLAGVHDSHESSGTVGGGISESLNPDTGSVAARLKPTPCEFCIKCRGGGVLNHGLFLASPWPLVANSSPSLLLLITARLDVDDGTGQPVGVLPTHKRHSRASPKARSQCPISRGGSPESLAQALFE